MRLIDADALPRLTQIFEANGKRREQEVVLSKIIDNAPTIDAVQVIRCKDCKYSRKDEHFCADGEKKDHD